MPAQAPAWQVQRYSDRIEASPPGLPAGHTFRFTAYAPQTATGDLAGWFRDRLAAVGTGLGVMVQEQGPKPDRLGGLPILVDTRVYRRLFSAPVMVISQAAERPDGRYALYSTTLSPDPALMRADLPVVAGVIAAQLRRPAAVASAPPPAAPSPPASPTLPVTAPGKGLPPDAIDHVGVSHWFGITPTGLSNTFTVYLFLKDGQVYADPVAAPADLDVARSKAQEPRRWGTWRLDGGTVRFTWPTEAHPEQSVEANSLVTCRPAEPGLHLEQDFTRTSGSGGLIPGGISTFSQAELHLHRDGSVDRGSATAVGGSVGVGSTATSVGGGVTGPSTTGHYTLDGYTIELDGPGGPQRRFFCRYTDDDTMVFVGGADWIVMKD